MELGSLISNGTETITIPMGTKLHGGLQLCLTIRHMEMVVLSSKLYVNELILDDSIIDSYNHSRNKDEDIIVYLVAHPWLNLITPYEIKWVITVKNIRGTIVHAKS
jgi:hypothetical protein